MTGESKTEAIRVALQERQHLPHDVVAELAKRGALKPITGDAAKAVTDNYSDAMHIAVAHPGLTRLFGLSYGLEAKDWVDKMWGYLRDVPSSRWRR